MKAINAVRKLISCIKLWLRKLRYNFLSCHWAFSNGLKRFKGILSLFIVFGILCQFNYKLIKYNPKFDTIDAPNHALFCFEFYREVKELFENKELNFFNKMKQFKVIFSTGIIYWPKFVYLTSFPFLYFLGPSPDTIKYINLFYLFLVMFFIYLLAIELGANNSEALLASTVVILYPMVLEVIPNYGLDFPLTNLIIIFFYLLLKTEYFKNTFYSLLLGIVLGISFLIKGQAVIFTIIPLVICFLNSIIKGDANKDSSIEIFKVIRNFSLVVLISSEIGSLWWNGKLFAIQSSINEHLFSKSKYLESYPLEKYASLSYYLFYLKYLFLDGLGPLVAIFSLIGFINYFSLIRNREKVILLIWIFFPILIFSFLFQVKQLRFIMPIIPAIGIVTILGSRFKYRVLRYSFRFLIIIFSIIQIFNNPSFSRIKSNFPYLFTSITQYNFSKKIEGTIPKVAELFIEKLKDIIEPGDYNVVILRMVSVEGGPVNLRFWLELKGYNEGYKFLTYDLYDQWQDTYRILESKSFCLILSVLNISDFGRDDFWERKMIFKSAKEMLPWYEEFKNDPLTKALVERVLPEVKKESVLISEFVVNHHLCRIYKYEHVPETH